MQEQNLLDFAAAATTYENLLSRHPNHRTALEKLRRILVRLRDVPRLAEVVIDLAGITDPPQDVMLLVEGARAIQGMGQLPAAVPIWGIVLDKAPGHDEAQETVMRYGRRSGFAPDFWCRERNLRRSDVNRHSRIPDIADGSLLSGGILFSRSPGGSMRSIRS